MLCFHQGVTPATRPCPRCGTFAPLAVSDWRTLCAPCIELTRGPLERVGPTFGSLMQTMLSVVYATWALMLPVVLLSQLPRIVGVWFWDAPLWAKLSYTAVIGSIAEAFVLRLCANRLLGGPAGYRAAWRQTLGRLLPVVAVNVLENAIVTLLLCTCVGAAYLIGMLLSAIPIALLEREPAHRALQLSWRRARPYWLALSLAALVLLSVDLVIGVPAGFVTGLLRSGSHGGPGSWMVPASRSATEALGMLMRPFSYAAELTAWAATLERPLHTLPVPPGDQTGGDP